MVNSPVARANADYLMRGEPGIISFTKHDVIKTEWQRFARCSTNYASTLSLCDIRRLIANYSQLVARYFRSFSYSESRVRPRTINTFTAFQVRKNITI